MKLNNNIYVIDLPINFGISSTFNIDFLVYKDHDVIPLVDKLPMSLFLSPLSDILPHIASQ